MCMAQQMIEDGDAFDIRKFGPSHSLMGDDDLDLCVRAVGEIARAKIVDMTTPELNHAVANIGE